MGLFDTVRSGAMNAYNRAAPYLSTAAKYGAPLIGTALAGYAGNKLYNSFNGAGNGAYGTNNPRGGSPDSAYMGIPESQQAAFLRSAANTEINPYRSQNEPSSAPFRFDYAHRFLNSPERLNQMAAGGYAEGGLESFAPPTSSLPDTIYNHVGGGRMGAWLSPRVPTAATNPQYLAGGGYAAGGYAAGGYAPGGFLNSIKTGIGNAYNTAAPYLSAGAKWAAPRVGSAVGSYLGNQLADRAKYYGGGTELNPYESPNDENRVMGRMPGPLAGYSHLISPVAEKLGSSLGNMAGNYLSNSIPPNYAAGGYADGGYAHGGGSSLSMPSLRAVEKAYDVVAPYFGYAPLSHYAMGGYADGGYTDGGYADGDYVDDDNDGLYNN